METVIDLTCNFVMMAGATYLGVAFVLEMVDRWNELDPATIQARKQARAEARALASKTPLALPAATTASVEIRQREQELVELEVADSDAID